MVTPERLRPQSSGISPGSSTAWVSTTPTDPGRGRRLSAATSSGGLTITWAGFNTELVALRVLHHRKRVPRVGKALDDACAQRSEPIDFGVQRVRRDEVEMEAILHNLSLRHMQEEQTWLETVWSENSGTRAPLPFWNALPRQIVRPCLVPGRWHALLVAQ